MNNKECQKLYNKYKRLSKKLEAKSINRSTGEIHANPIKDWDSFDDTVEKLKDCLSFFAADKLEIICDDLYIKENYSKISQKAKEILEKGIKE